MSLRKIFQAPLLFKRSPIFKQCLCTHHVCQAKIIENDNKSFAIENTNEDKIPSELNTFSLSKILLVLEKNEKLINGSHLLLAATKFYKLYKIKSDSSTKVRFPLQQKELSDQELEGKVAELYSMINLNINKLSVTESTHLIYIFWKMKLKGSTTVMQSLLKHIKENINKLSLVDFRKLSSILKQMPDSVLIKDLHSTLERGFIIQLEAEFNSNDIDHLESALNFIADNLDNYKLLQLCINGLLNYKGEISGNIATSIFHSLCLMKQYPPGWLNVLERIQQTLIEHVDELRIDQILFILFLIGEKCRLNRKDEFYNESLCNALVTKIITDDSGFEYGLSALKSLSYIRFANIELLNYTCAAYFERINLSSEIIEDEFFKLMTLITCLAAVKHKTVFFDDIKDCLLNNKQLLKCNYESICILALNLINLDYYPTKLLSKVFDGKGNYAKKSAFLHWTFCKVYQKLKTNPTYNGPMPSKTQMQALKQFHYKCYLQKKKIFNGSVLHELEKEMGGPSYIKSNISSKLFHLIDHAVAFSKDGSPISINEDADEKKYGSVEYVEDLKVPLGSQIVLILFMPSFWYSRNKKELFSTYSCVIETLEALSYAVVEINESTWVETPFEERSSMLMNKIRSKLVLD